MNPIIANAFYYSRIVELLLSHTSIQVNDVINVSVRELMQYARKKGVEKSLQALIHKYQGEMLTVLLGFTALHAAIFFGYDEIAKALFAAQALLQCID